jgi:hypothetical protein
MYNSYGTQFIICSALKGEVLRIVPSRIRTDAPNPSQNGVFQSLFLLRELNETSIISKIMHDLITIQEHIITESVHLDLHLAVNMSISAKILIPVALVPLIRATA